MEKGGTECFYPQPPAGRAARNREAHAIESTPTHLPIPSEAAPDRNPDRRFDHPWLPVPHRLVHHPALALSVHVDQVGAVLVLSAEVVHPPLVL